MTQDTEDVRLSLNYGIDLSYSLQFLQRDVSYDVLQQHQNRNRVPLPPNPQQLEEIRSRRGNVTEVDGDGGTEQVVDNPEPSSGGNKSKPRAKRHSSKPYVGRSGDPKKLGFYPPQWRIVLERATKSWRLWMAIMCGFPRRGSEAHFKKAMDCVVDALDKHQKEGGMIEDGKRVPPCTCYI